MGSSKKRRRMPSMPRLLMFDKSDMRRFSEFVDRLADQVRRLELTVTTL